jgi:hypothetical protein
VWLIQLCSFIFEIFMMCTLIEGAVRIRSGLGAAEVPQRRPDKPGMGTREIPQPRGLIQVRSFVLGVCVCSAGPEISAAPDSLGLDPSRQSGRF